MKDIGPTLNDLMQENVSSFLAFLILKGEEYESVSKFDVSNKSVFDSTESPILSTK